MRHSLLLRRVYKVRIPSDPGSEDSPRISTSIPAKCLISSGMQDHLQVSFCRKINDTSDKIMETVAYDIPSDWRSPFI